METKIIRNDRGLDFRRIEQFIKMFQEKCQKKSRSIDNLKSSGEKERKEKAFEHFGLVEDFKAIDDIDIQVEILKKQKAKHEERIMDFTKRPKDRYGHYDEVKEDSLIHEFISKDSEHLTLKRDEVWKLNSQIANELWYAKDLEQAIEIINKFQELLDGICLEEAEK